MLKKIFVGVLFAATIYYAAVLLVINADSADDVFIQHSRINDTDAAVYVNANTFDNQTQNKSERKFSVDVKIVCGTVIMKNNYSFREKDGVIYYSVDGGTDKFITEDEFAEAIWNYGLKHLGLDYEIRCDG